VLVGGNQTTVGEGVSVKMSGGVSDGVGDRPEQEARTSPPAARIRVQFRFDKIVSFIRLKFCRLFGQGVVQSIRTLETACFIILLRIAQI
jgi:hypothetical protein